MSSIQHFEDLEAWQVGRTLTKQVYKISRRGGFSKDYAMKDQIRRASLSITCNIAEGFERNSNKEFIYFLSIAKGSAGEVRSLLYAAFDERYISQEEFEELKRLTRQNINLIGGLIQYLQKTPYQGKRKKYS